VTALGLDERPVPTDGRPHMMLNMVSSADGRATLDGRSGGLSDTADRALFHGLRGAVDAVLAGAGTVRHERYGRLIPQADRRDLRLRAGMTAEPLACIVSESLQFGDEVGLLAEPEAHVAILTRSAGKVQGARAQVDYVRAESHGSLDLRAALMELHERFEICSLLCEGGPHLGCELLAQGLVDELFLSLSPTLLGGVPDGSDALRILAGAELDPPVKLELLSVFEANSGLFLRYAVSECDRVSRATMLSSSLAS
jgi:riboflavin biosynthesis pyrimidine reductase